MYLTSDNAVYLSRQGAGIAWDVPTFLELLGAHESRPHPRRAPLINPEVLRLAREFLALGQCDAD